MSSPTETLVRLIGESHNRPENRNPGHWDGTITEGKMGSFTFKNQVAGEPLDLVRTRLWESWGIDIETCKVCTYGPYSSAYEVTLEWGDTGQTEYISEVCSRCLNTINTTIARNGRADKHY